MSIVVLLACLLLVLVNEYGYICCKVSFKLLCSRSKPNHITEAPRGTGYAKISQP